MAMKFFMHGQHLTGLTDVWKIAKHCANDVSIKMMKTPYPGGTPLGAEVNISSYSGARGDCLIFFHVQLYSN